MIQAAWQRLRTDSVLKEVFVLQSDVFRLAIVWLDGGWWLDADLVCIDSLSETLNSIAMREEIAAAALRWQRSTVDLPKAPTYVGNKTGSSMMDGSEIEMNSKNGRKGGDGNGNDDYHRQTTRPQVGCVLAWEGEVPLIFDSLAPSSPLNWAFGCRAGHSLLWIALVRAARNILAWTAERPAPHLSMMELPPGWEQFAARVRVNVEDQHGRQPEHHSQKGVLVDVLRLTGPALFEASLSAYVADQYASFGQPLEQQRNLLQELRREITGETPGDSKTWDRATLIPEASNRAPSACASVKRGESREQGREGGEGGIVVLPYCMFRSRGCPHLLERFSDRTIFHHEFDTDWRLSWWHNYLPGEAFAGG